MYKIEKTDYGYFLTFEGLISRHEMESWYSDSVNALENPPKSFGVMVDLRNLQTPLPIESQSKLEEGQKYYKRRGMKRSVVVLKNEITKIQYKRIAMNTGIRKNERYIDASLSDDWKTIGLKWLTDGVDPE
ncbi:MAG: hypothetical protein AAFQ94_01065 [Bacteroidota bacterium]